MRTLLWRFPVLMVLMGVGICFPPKADGRDRVYVALGNSYTAGTGVDPDHAWPFLLAQRLQEKGIRVGETHNLAVAGSGIQELIEAQLPRLKQLKPDLITLQIGVNDWVRSTGARRFIHRVKWLLSELSSLGSPPPTILLISLPDFSCAPSIKPFGYGKSARNGMKRFNRMLKKQAQDQSVAYADVFAISKKACGNAQAYSKDGLHPSREQYEDWVELILPVVVKAWERSGK